MVLADERVTKSVILPCEPWVLEAVEFWLERRRLVVATRDFLAGGGGLENKWYTSMFCDKTLMHYLDFVYSKQSGISCSDSFECSTDY